jgi:hypothetical protein
MKFFNFNNKFLIIYETTQFDDSGHRILQENTANRWNMEAVFPPENDRIFSGGFLSTACAFRQKTIGNHWKKS